MNAILTLINADLCKNVSRHSNVFIYTFYASDPFNLFFYLINCDFFKLISTNNRSTYELINYFD